MLHGEEGLDPGARLAAGPLGPLHPQLLQLLLASGDDDGGNAFVAAFAARTSADGVRFGGDRL